MTATDMNSLIAQALGLHQRGQLEQAAELYGQALQRDPKNFAALQLLGVLRSQQGRNAEAKNLLEAALAIKPVDYGALANYGQVLVGAGHYQQALDAFDKALSLKPDFFEAFYNKGVALAQMQRPAEAVANFDRALMLNPRHAPCLYSRGLLLATLGRREEAMASYEAALALNPNMAAAWTNRGNILRELGRAGHALESYDRALALVPGDITAHYNRGNALCDLQRFGEAVADYDRALGLQPGFAQAWSSRGTALLALERYDEALESFDKALALRAADVEALNNRGVALWHLNRPLEARSCYDQALAAEPGHTPTLLNRAQLLQGTGQFAAALADYDTAVAAEPGNARAWNGRGSVLHALKRGSEALANFDKALALEPGFADALANRSLLHWTERGDFAGAVSDIEAALAVNPAQPFARGELLHLKMFGADWEGFDQETKAIDDAVRQGQRVVRPFVYQALSHSPADLQSCSRIFAASLPSSPSDKPASFAHGHEKIRIGYVSAEFREQATAYLMAGLYEHHDRDKFEIIAIDNGGGDASPMRRRLESAFDRFLYISQMSDAEASDRIRREEIDILVNLNGYFGTPRMGIFARRAAPIQVNYLGFPATLGTSCMDYILADCIVIPEAERCFYDEQVVYLPHSYQANDNKRPIADEVPSRAALGLPEDGFVFCNFNQSYKITPAVFASWVRILREVEGSVLWLLTNRPPFETNLSKAAEQHGVDRRRLVFAPSLPPDRHLARLKQADLFIDSLPYNAHTTASDALWAGVPLITCRGTTFPGRVAASLLNAVGMPELIMESMEDYEARAIALARDPHAMAGLKQILARNRLTHPLFDTDLFRRDIETAYTAMWQAWRKGESPNGLSVEPAAAAPD
jgi:protein O-GlcNAc transferase